MSSNNFINKKVSVDPVKSEDTNPQQETQFKISPPPTPVGWLVISRDKQTGGGVKMALYNKLPNKFQQFLIKWFFGWWVEEELQQTKE